VANQPGDARPTISTHVLDAARGVPAAGVDVVLVRLEDRTVFGPRPTDADGRIRDLLGGQDLRPGLYELTFETGSYGGEDGGAAGAAGASGADGRPFFVQATLTLDIVDVGRSYHVPLLLSPFAMTTYRGS
jgi:5-hydroxyisourate hydrolase